jgi:fructokinase
VATGGAPPTGPFAAGARDDGSRAGGGRVVLFGEALIDLAPRDGLLLPLPGGSPYNVAVGLGRLGVPTSFVGPTGNDGFGDLLRSRLAEAGVDLASAPTVDAPTTLAVVHLDEQARASYGFYLTATSAAAVRPDGLPRLDGAVAVHLSLGALTLDTEPAGTAFTALIHREAGHRTVSLDPNVRPSVIADLPSYARRIDALVARCDLVKVSDEDLALLHPDEPPAAVARRWVRSGPAAVVVTRGANGALGLTAEGDEVEVPGEDVDVVDTVGAGDAFTSGLLAALHDRGLLERDRLRDVGIGDLRASIHAAVHVAAVTCTRAGSDPPSRDELHAR